MRIDGNIDVKDLSRTENPSKNFMPDSEVKSPSAGAWKVEISDEARQSQSSLSGAKQSISSDEIEQIASSDDMIAEVMKSYSPQTIRKRQV